MHGCVYGLTGFGLHSADKFVITSGVIALNFCFKKYRYIVLIYNIIIKSCEQKNAADLYSFEICYILFAVPPVIRDPEPIHTVVEGDPLKLRCDASGNPKPTITWWIDGYPIKSDTNKVTAGELAFVYERHDADA